MCRKQGLLPVAASADPQDDSRDQRTTYKPKSHKKKKAEETSRNQGLLPIAARSDREDDDQSRSSKATPRQGGTQPHNVESDIIIAYPSPAETKDPETVALFEIVRHRGQLERNAAQAQTSIRPASDAIEGMVPHSFPATAALPMEHAGSPDLSDLFAGHSADYNNLRQRLMSAESLNMAADGLRFAHLQHYGGGFSAGLLASMQERSRAEEELAGSYQRFLALNQIAASAFPADSLGGLGFPLGLSRRGHSSLLDAHNFPSITAPMLWPPL